MELKYCGSSTVTYNKQKHSQNVYLALAAICAHKYTIIAALLHFLQVSPVFDLLFYRSARPFYLSPIAESRSAVARDVDYPSRTMARVNAWRVRSRL